MRTLSDAIIKGNHTKRTVLLQAYGDYLLHGGTPEGFLNLTDDDVQIMYTVGQAERVQMMETVIKSVAKMLGAKEI